MCIIAPFAPLLIAMLLAASALNAHAESVRIVAEDDFFPYAANHEGKPQGFAVDVVAAAYKSGGDEATFITLPYARAMKEVDDGREIGAFDTTDSPDNQKAYYLHKPELFRAKISIYARSDHPEANLTEAGLAGKKVGVTNGYTYTDTFDTSTVLTRDPAPGDLQMLKKLSLGRTDYAVAYDQVAMWLISQNPTLRGTIKPVGTLAEFGLFVSFSRAHPDGKKWCDKLSAGLLAIQADGTYAKIQDTWAEKLK